MNAVLTETQHALVKEIGQWQNGHDILSQLTQPNHQTWWNYLNATVAELWGRLTVEAQLVAVIASLQAESTDSLGLD